MGRRFIFSLLAVVLLVVSAAVAPREASASSEAPKYEMRAAWIATVTNIDMKAGMTKDQYSSWAKETLDQLKGQNFNTVIFQVRPTNDALYNSKLAPWSSFITGKAQGTNPGYDPLQIMVEEAHKRGMELHAWMNPYRVTMPNKELSTLDANNVALTNPDWVVKYGTQYYLNPGLPAVQDYLAAVVKELVTNYDIDAIHMDDYFYPYKIANTEFPDQATFKQYGSSFNSIDDWRRNNVNNLVSKIYTTIKSTKSHVQYGISPFGVWRNKSSDTTGSDTRAGVENYDDLYADTRQWIKDGTIDYITPQIYWSRSLAVANYSILLDWWSKEIQTYASKHPVNLYIGLADYKVNNDSDKAWSDKMELPNQIIANRANGVAKGQMHYSLKRIKENQLGYATIVKDQLYNYKAIAPATSWSNAEQPAKPTNVTISKETAGNQLTITGQARKFVIYRFDGTSAGSYQDAQNIVDVVYNTNGNTVFTDQTADPNKTYTYGVTSLSGTNVESKDAAVVRIGDLSSSFKDISPSYRAFMEIEYLAKQGIVQGELNGNYNPSRLVTRAEAAAMLG
ncbi:MAG: family 10 glycosylhydrolase, partial [Bacillus sp. (in: firmicutes)]